VGYRIDWATDAGRLAAIEPEPAELTAFAAQLAVGYNDPANAPLMGHTETISADEVVAHYAEMGAEGARQFLLFVGEPSATPGVAERPGQVPAVDRTAPPFAGAAGAAQVPAVDRTLVGDADLRGFDGGGAEFAFMIAAPMLQGKGLGTRFALMIHALGFRNLGLARIYASVVPNNAASRRVFEKLGYVVDDSASARAFADEPGDVVLSIDRATFEQRNADALAHVQISFR
jgi:RimJ/RimL family protein N-acetyltransferase